jgi:hypothetical protein
LVNSGWRCGHRTFRLDIAEGARRVTPEALFRIAMRPAIYGASEEARG